MIKTSQLSWAINYWRCSTATDDNHLSLLDPIQSKTQLVSTGWAHWETYYLLSRVARVNPCKPPHIYVICKAPVVEIVLIRVRSRAMSILRRVLDKAVRLTALAGIGYLLVTIVITFVTRFQNSFLDKADVKTLTLGWYLSF